MPPEKKNPAKRGQTQGGARSAQGSGFGAKRNRLRAPLHPGIDALPRHTVEVLERVGANPAKDTQLVRCIHPEHADENPSMRVTVHEDGSVDLFCTSRRCDVYRYLGIRPRGDAAKQRKERKAEPAVPRPVPSTVPPLPDSEIADAKAAAKDLAGAAATFNARCTVYPYRSAHGDVLFFKYRFDRDGKKVMRPFHHDGDQWQHGQPAQPRNGWPLYGLPELNGVEGPVLIVEGEKAVDALAARGIVATTSGSATSAPQADWSPLAGRPCIVWPDNDSAGDDYAAAVIERLRAIGCEVSLIDSQSLDLPHKGDAADWLATHPKAKPRDVYSLPRLPLPPTPDALLADALRPIDDATWEQAAEPHPHTFQAGDVGLFPRGEVTIIASPSRAGKTFTMMAIAVAAATGDTLGTLPLQSPGAVVILSAEDTPRQYARKLRATVSKLSKAKADAARASIYVPDFGAEGLSQFRQLVSLDYGQPAIAAEVERIIEALAALQARQPIGLVIVETASTWNGANEDNPSFRALIAALRSIARTLDVAVVITHHVNQASGANLSTLNVSVADVRGGTTFVDNARQVCLLVNLGSDDNPPAENTGDDDARVVLRRMVEPQCKERMVALIVLNSSQGADVPPMFFRQVLTDNGVFYSEVKAPSFLAGHKWQAVHSLVRAKRDELKPKRAEKQRGPEGNLPDVVEIVAHLHKLGTSPTARAVSLRAGHSGTWATEALNLAVERGLLVAKKEKVPRVKERVVVYRPPPVPTRD